MTKLKDSCVLITGGASGIGRIMGRIVLEKGAKQLIIWDINEQNIENTVAELKNIGCVIRLQNRCFQQRTGSHLLPANRK